MLLKYDFRNFVRRYFEDSICSKISFKIHLDLWIVLSECFLIF